LPQQTNRLLKTTLNFDKNALPHSFNIDDLVWYKDFAPLGKNPKLTPKWQGPAKITEINDTIACILLPNVKSKVLNVMQQKSFSLHLVVTTVTIQMLLKTLTLTVNQNFLALKKLMDHKNVVQLAINVLYDLSKKHCAMCKWEQECSDNPLLFDPMFACQYIKECQSWLINKQSVCAKCKLQLGQHIVDNQAQNEAPASNSIHQQCHHFDQKCESSEKDAFPFQELNSKELIDIQNSLRNSNNVINAHNSDSSDKINQEQMGENLIDTMDNEIF
jgi:hypothetical protein